MLHAFDVRAGVIYDLGERYSEQVLAGDDLLRDACFGIHKHDLAIDDVQSRFRPKVILEMRQFLGNFSKVLKRHIVLHAQHFNRAQRHNILERIESTES